MDSKRKRADTTSPIPNDSSSSSSLFISSSTTDSKDDVKPKIPVKKNRSAAKHYRERKKQRVAQLRERVARVQQENVDLKDQLDVLNTTAGSATAGDTAMKTAAEGLDVVCEKKEATDQDFEIAIKTLAQTVGAHLARLGYHLEMAECMLIPVKTYQVLLYIFTEERRPVTVDNRDPTLAHYLDELLNVTPEQIEGREVHREMVLERCAQLHASLERFKTLRGTATSELKEFYGGIKDLQGCFTVEQRANFLRMVYNDQNIRKLLKATAQSGTPRSKLTPSSDNEGDNTGESSNNSSSSSSSSSNGSNTGPAPRFSTTAMERFMQSTDKLKDYPSISRSCPGKFQWFISDSTSKATGTNGTEAFVFDLTKSPGETRQGTCRNPDAVLCLEELDFFRMMEGDCNGQELFVSQKMEISGNIKMTLKLWHCVESLQDAEKIIVPKIKSIREQYH